MTGSSVNGCLESGLYGGLAGLSIAFDSVSLIPLGAAVLAILISAIVLNRRKRQLAHRMFLLLTMSSFIWAIIQFLRMNLLLWLDPTDSRNQSLYWFTHLALFAGVSTISTHSLLFAAAFTRRLEWTRGYRRMLAYLPTVLYAAFMPTNPLHHLFFATYTPEAWTYGPAFWLFTAASYILIIWPIGWYLRMAWEVREKIHRNQVMVMAVAAIPPLVGNLLWLTRQWGVPLGFDLTPLFFTITNAVFAYALLKMGWLNILPVAIGGVPFDGRCGRRPRRRRYGSAAQSCGSRGLSGHCPVSGSRFVAASLLRVLNATAEPTPRLSRSLTGLPIGDG
jgi:hypothetical protein